MARGMAIDGDTHRLSMFLLSKSRTCVHAGQYRAGGFSLFGFVVFFSASYRGQSAGGKSVRARLKPLFRRGRLRRGTKCGVADSLSRWRRSWRKSPLVPTE